MAEGSNMLIMFMAINIVLYIGANGMGSDKANLIKDDLFTNSALLKLTGDKVTPGDAVSDKLNLQQGNIIAEVVGFIVFDALPILWDVILTLINIAFLPFTLMYNLFASAQAVGQMISLLIFAPLSIAYIYALYNFIRGTGG